MLSGKFKPTKGWDYEDDHDYDDAIDYAAQNMVYWYGKYYPKEKIDALFAQEEKRSGGIGSPLLALVGIVGIYGAYELTTNYFAHRDYEKKKKKIQEEREKKMKSEKTSSGES